MSTIELFENLLPGVYMGPFKIGTTLETVLDCIEGRGRLIELSDSAILNVGCYSLYFEFRYNRSLTIIRAFEGFDGKIAGRTIIGATLDSMQKVLGEMRVFHGVDLDEWEPINYRGLFFVLDHADEVVDDPLKVNPEERCVERVGVFSENCQRMVGNDAEARMTIVKKDLVK